MYLCKSPGHSHSSEPISSHFCIPSQALYNGQHAKDFVMIFGRHLKHRYGPGKKGLALRDGFSWAGIRGARVEEEPAGIYF